jgi:hypothetical protein
MVVEVLVVVKSVIYKGSEFGLEVFTEPVDVDNCVQVFEVGRGLAKMFCHIVHDDICYMFETARQVYIQDVDELGRRVFRETCYFIGESSLYDPGALITVYEDEGDNVKSAIVDLYPIVKGVRTAVRVIPLNHYKELSQIVEKLGKNYAEMVEDSKAHVIITQNTKISEPLSKRIKDVEGLIWLS